MPPPFYDLSEWRGWLAPDLADVSGTAQLAGGTVSGTLATNATCDGTHAALLAMTSHCYLLSTCRLACTGLPVTATATGLIDETGKRHLPCLRLGGVLTVLLVDVRVDALAVGGVQLLFAPVAIVGSTHRGEPVGHQTTTGRFDHHGFRSGGWSQVFGHVASMNGLGRPVQHYAAAAKLLPLPVRHGTPDTIFDPVVHSVL